MEVQLFLGDLLNPNKATLALSLPETRGKERNEPRLTVSAVLRSPASLQTRDLPACWAVWFFRRLRQPGGSRVTTEWPVAIVDICVFGGGGDLRVLVFFFFGLVCSAWGEVGLV